jgi:hypothetical protein
MKNKFNASFLLSPIPEFGTEPAQTFYGKVFAPHHSPCWCIKPSEFSLYSTMIENLKLSETEYLKQNKQLWIIGFTDNQCEISLMPFSFLLTESSLERPTTEQLSRLENWYACVNYAISSIKSKNMGGY